MDSRVPAMVSPGFVKLNISGARTSSNSRPLCRVVTSDRVATVLIFPPWVELPDLQGTALHPVCGTERSAPSDGSGDPGPSSASAEALRTTRTGAAPPLFLGLVRSRLP